MKNNLEMFGSLRAVFVVVFKRRDHFYMHQFESEVEANKFWKDCKQNGWTLPGSNGPVLTWI